MSDAAALPETSELPAAVSTDFRFKRRESVPDGVRRIVLEQTVKAAAGLSGDEPAVHNARKCLKKIRSVLRLMRSELGSDVYAFENKWFRQTAAQLSDVRDAEAMIESWDQLAVRFEDMQNDAQQLQVRQYLEQRHRELRGHADKLAERAAAIAIALQVDVPQRVAQWPLKRKGFKTIAKGFKRNYKRACKLMKQSAKDGSDKHFHDWRKRIKDLWYHCSLLRSSSPKFFGPRIHALDELGECLGDDHDLSVLRAQLLQDGSNASALVDHIDEHRSELQEQALKQGRRILDLRPAAMLDKISEHWASWKQT